MSEQLRDGSAETIGQRLRRLRLERGLSQRDLAEKGVSYAYISRIEGGARRPSVKALRMLARKLGVSADYLETGSEIRDTDKRELRIADAELELRLAGTSPEAEGRLAELRDEALAAGDTLAASRAGIALGLAAATTGRNAEAIELLKEGLDLAPVSPGARPDVFATLGQAYSSSGRPDKAVAVFEECLDELRELDGDDLAAEIRFATYLSYALADCRDLGAARTIVKEALARAEGAADPYSRVRLYWSLARLALMEGKPRTALRQIHRAIGLLEATEDTRQLGRAHLSCAEILLDDGDAAAAVLHLDQAERLLGDAADAADLGWLWSERARERTAAGEHDEAAGLAGRALKILQGSDPLKLARAHAALAGANMAAGDVDEAHAEYERSVKLFIGENRWQEAAATSRDWAHALRAAGRDDAALDVLDRAADYAARAPVGATAR